jgi:hypothetical protein
LLCHYVTPFVFVTMVTFPNISHVHLKEHGAYNHSTHSLPQL